MHFTYVALMIFIIATVTFYISYTGYTYYKTPLEERFYHPQYKWFKPSGVFGHGLGIIGTLMIFFGVTLYIARKRYNFLSRTIRLKYLLEFHIFLCTLGPILVLFHTAFKFGGIVSIAFWSMVAVVLSGVVGRFIYIQIPRTIEGRELTLNEVKGLKTDLFSTITDEFEVDAQMKQLVLNISNSDKPSNKDVSRLKRSLRKKKFPKEDRKYILKLVKDDMSLSRKIRRLVVMQKLFKYWHVAHLPFALVMLVIVVIHVAITLAFGYKWIF